MENVCDPVGDVITQIGCLAQLGRKTYQSYYLLSGQPTKKCFTQSKLLNIKIQPALIAFMNCIAAKSHHILGKVLQQL